jgi:Holliday junction resolvase RusA-like endonuclease
MDDAVLVFEVRAMPGPQGSKRFVGTSKAGRGILVESSAKVKPWREAVVYAAREGMAARRAWDAERVHLYGVGTPTGPAFPLDGPLWVSMIFTLPKPRAAPKRTRTWPDKKPDLSKLARSTEDALSDAGVWADDARVVRYAGLAKVFPGEDPDALDVPGCRIRIGRIVGA